MISAAFNLVDFIDWLNDCPMLYLVAWGYENLPAEISGGDVDIYVHPEHYNFVANELVRRGYSNTKCPRHKPFNHHHEHFSREGDYSIDLFSNLCFAYKGKTMIFPTNPDEVLNKKRIQHFNIIYEDKRGLSGMFWTPSKLIEALFTALRIVGGRTDCISRLEKYLE